MQRTSQGSSFWLELGSDKEGMVLEPNRARTSFLGARHDFQRSALKEFFVLRV